MAKKRQIGEINSSSMADIAFLLLIFFLVTTSMSTSTGLARKLPQPLPPGVKPPETDVNKRNIFVVKINSQNQLLVQGEMLELKDLRERAKEFIKNEDNADNLPVKSEIDVPLIGKVEVTKDHVISLQNDVDTQYQSYIEVQNELVAAYNELRNELAKQEFGKLFSDCDQDQQDAVQKVYPQKISEAEPKNYGGVK